MLLEWDVLQMHACLRLCKVALLTMRLGVQAVAVLGTHPAWKLHAADLTCASLDELAVYNMRRLFAMAGNERMDVQEQRHIPSNRPVRWQGTAVADP